MSSSAVLGMNIHETHILLQSFLAGSALLLATQTPSSANTSFDGNWSVPRHDNGAANATPISDIGSSSWTAACSPREARGVSGWGVTGGAGVRSRGDDARHRKHDHGRRPSRPGRGKRAMDGAVAFRAMRRRVAGEAQSLMTRKAERRRCRPRSSPMAGSAYRLKLVLTATSIVAAIGLGSLPAFAQLGFWAILRQIWRPQPHLHEDPVPRADDHGDGCSDKDDPHVPRAGGRYARSTVAGYQVVVDGSGHIRCRARARR